MKPLPLLASSMYIFTQSRLEDSKSICLQRAYASIILQIISQLPNNNNIKIEEIKEKLANKTFSTSTINPIAFQEAIESLYNESAISFVDDDFSMLNLEPTGQNILDDIASKRDLARERFEESCLLFLRNEHSKLTPKQTEAIIEALKLGLVRAYAKRGMEFARAIFTDISVDVSNATDILETINNACPKNFSNDEGMAFADLMVEVMLEPNQNVKDYLAILSQGYFAYHALGLEPKCSAERLKMALDRDWIIDSSVLLPILATNCLNHSYAIDLLTKIQKLGLKCYTTEKLFYEILEHASWAIINFGQVQSDDPRFLQASMATYGYKQNLFLDGYIKWSLTQGNPSFREYLKTSIGAEFEEDRIRVLKDKIQSLGVLIKDFSDWDGINLDSFVEVTEVSKVIEQIRSDYGTYRSVNQCTAEAEVFVICQNNKAQFLSQSGVLDRLLRSKTRITWKPEAMYRFLSLFSTAPTDVDLLYQCMVQDFYYAGFNIVDRESISLYVKPMINQARMQFDQEKKRYEEALGRTEFSNLKEKFERTPDEQKPFYSLQFSHFVALKEIRKRETAEAQAALALKTKKLTDKEREQLARLKAEKEKRRQKHLKKVRRTASKKKK